MALENADGCHPRMETTSLTQYRQDQAEQRAGLPACCGKAQFERKQKKVKPQPCGGVRLQKTQRASEPQKAGRGGGAVSHLGSDLMRSEGSLQSAPSPGECSSQRWGTRPQLLLGSPSKTKRNSAGFSNTEKLHTAAITSATSGFIPQNAGMEDGKTGRKKRESFLFSLSLGLKGHV